jgi:hypothetical protein
MEFTFPLWEEGTVHPIDAGRISRFSQDRWQPIARLISTNTPREAAELTRISTWPNSPAAIFQKP